jgi:hypothetical protein
MDTFWKEIGRRAVAVAFGASVVLSCGIAVATAARGESARSSSTGWPKSFVAGNGATVTIHQPQISEWPNQSAVTFYSAVSYRPISGLPAFGTVAAEADTTVSFANRRVHFSRFAVVDASFPTLKPDDVAEIKMLIEKRLPPEGRTMTLDEVLAAVQPRPLTPRNTAGLKADPPHIFVSMRPAMLVNIDGSPVWRPVDAGPLQYAINTNCDLFRDPPTGASYLRDAGGWLTATNVLGPWTRTGKLPASFDSLPAGDRWASVRSALPPSNTASKKAPVVFVSRQPAELIAFNGAPAYRQVAGAATLNWVSNTDADVFREGTTGTVYYLVAGRWFAAPDFTGPWTFSTRDLPASFARIPLSHPRSHVLASVPGTPQATEAILLAQARHSARVNKKGLKAPEVMYDGPPSFVLIQGTPVARAVNTDKDILKAGRMYYMCLDGVWFSASAARGPWRVTGEIPAAIYQIPPSSPAYRVTHVVVEDDYEDWTTFATTAAYDGTLVAGGTVVWGTGIDQPSYVGKSARDPLYVPAPATYGMGAWYNPWTASFGRARSGYGPSPAAATRGGVFESWDARLVQRADQPLALRANREVVGTTGELTTAPANRERPIYAGRDGSVYRRSAGGWERNEKGRWVAINTPSLNDRQIVRQLDSDARTRVAGAERSRVAAGLHSEWGPRAASYRPSAGRGER